MTYSQLAVVDRGEYTLHPAFERLRVAASQWAQMSYDQQQTALSKIHSCSVEDVSRTDVSTITAAVSEVSNPILKAILDAGVDWIPRDSLALTADKAAKLGNDGATVALPSVGTIDTFIVPSKSDPKKPHIVNIHPNGKCECDNCHAYKSSFICAHVIAACVKKSRLMDFLRWLVTSKRKTGGVNYSEAISFGMPKGRGRKGEAAPRKRNNRKVTKQSVTVQRVPTENTQQVQPISPTSPSTQVPPPNAPHIEPRQPQP